MTDAVACIATLAISITCIREKYILKAAQSLVGERYREGRLKSTFVCHVVLYATVVKWAGVQPTLIQMDTRRLMISGPIFMISGH